MLLNGNTSISAVLAILLLVTGAIPTTADLTPLLADGRSHRIHYEIGSASSNTLILQVPQE
ncbi:MAG TPA: hypothetical protein VFR05_02585 [Terriglobia bacterium]|nr:hypothetical protein [Terriglobia bacterium]